MRGGSRRRPRRRRRHPCRRPRLARARRWRTRSRASGMDARVFVSVFSFGSERRCGSQRARSRAARTSPIREYSFPRVSGVGDGGADHSAPARASGRPGHPPRCGEYSFPRVSGFVGGPGGGGARAKRERRPARASRRERLVGVVSSRRRRDRGRRAEHHPGRTRHGRDFTDGPPRPSPACQPLAGPPPAARPAAAPAVPSVSSRSSRGAPLGSSLALDDARLDIPASVRLPARHRLRCDGVQTSSSSSSRSLARCPHHHTSPPTSPSPADPGEIPAACCAPTRPTRNPAVFFRIHFLIYKPSNALDSSWSEVRAALRGALRGWREIPRDALRLFHGNRPSSFAPVSDHRRVESESFAPDLCLSLPPARLLQCRPSRRRSRRPPPLGKRRKHPRIPRRRRRLRIRE